MESEEDPEERANLHFILGKSRENLLEVEQAIASFQESLRIRPDHVPSLWSLAKLTLKKQNYADSERYFHLLLEKILDDATDEERIEIHMSLGENCLGDGPG